MKKWKLVFKTKNHFYWKHNDGYFNCTLTETPPDADAGYGNLDYLLWVKNEMNEEHIK